MFEPIGVERLKYDLELKYGMRDGLSCPVGGRWMVVFWSRKVLSSALTQPLRVVIFAAASYAALRLEQLAGPDPKRLGSRRSLTPRETSVLRLASTGAQCHSIAQELGLTEDQVRALISVLDIQSRTFPDDRRPRYYSPDDVERIRQIIAKKP